MKKYILKSSFFALILQVTNIISALIIPRLIISNYGSEINGLITSITQLLGYVSLLQFGIGPAFRYMCYNPLFNKNMEKLNSIYYSGKKYFNKIGIVCFIYILFICVISPTFNPSNCDLLSTIFLVMALGINTIAEYLFGFVNSNLLIADKKSYICDILYAVTVIVNIIVTIILIKLKIPIFIVKLVTSILFGLKNILLAIYVNKNYKFNKTSETSIIKFEKQNDAFSLSVADFIHKKMDIFLLTFFSSLTNVSIYSVYQIINTGLNSICMIANNAFQATFGHLIASQDTDKINDIFEPIEFIYHLFCTVIFSSALILIIPFIRIYSNTFNDANYINYGLAFFVLLGEFLFCLRQPYYALIMAGGDFKSAKKGAYIEAFINGILSIVLFNFLELNGLAIGTAIAMLYRMVSIGKYLQNHILYLNYRRVLKRFCITLINSFFLYFLIGFSPLINTSTYTIWTLKAIVVVIIVIITTFLFNYLFYKEKCINFINIIYKKLTSFYNKK